MQFQHARPVTLKRADIKKQLQNTVSEYMTCTSYNITVCNLYIYQKTVSWYVLLRKLILTRLYLVWPISVAIYSENLTLIFRV